MDMEQVWAAYVRKVVDMRTPGADQTAIGKHIGVSQGTISRWLGGRYLPDKAAIVAHFAQRYDRNVLEAFVAAGMLDLSTAARGLPAESAFLIRGLQWGVSEGPSSLGDVAETGGLEGPGDDSI